MKNILRMVVAVYVLALSSGALAGKVYKWLDDEGVPQYTDSAPKDREYTIVESYVKSKKPAASAAESEVATTETAEKPDFEREKLIRAEQARLRVENCKNARANLKTLTENARIRMLGDDGEFRYLTEEERQAQVKQAQEIISNNCEA